MYFSSSITQLFNNRFFAHSNTVCLHIQLQIVHSGHSMTVGRHLQKQDGERSKQFPSQTRTWAAAPEAARHASGLGTIGAALIILCLKFMRAARCATGVLSFASPLPLPCFCSPSLGSASAGGRRLLPCSTTAKCTTGSNNAAQQQTHDSSNRAADGAQRFAACACSMQSAHTLLLTGGTAYLYQTRRPVVPGERGCCAGAHNSYAHAA